MNKPWTPEEDAILIERFKNGKSIKEVMALLPHRTYNAIRSRANERLGVKMKKPPIHNRKYFEILNEENCSIAGFFAADAGISDRKRLHLNLASKDRGHLETIARLLEYNGRIYDYSRKYDLNVNKYNKTSNYKGTIYISVLQIQCPELCDAMQKHFNITTRKTRTLSPPNLTDIRLIMSYISGFIDGDGWIIEDRYNAEFPTYSICVMGTTEMISWIKTTFDNLCPNSDTAKLQPTESENIVDYKINGAKAYWLGKIFLNLNIPRLDRKWDKIRKFIQNIETNPNLSKKMINNIIKIQPNDEVIRAFDLKSKFLQNNNLQNEMQTFAI